MLGGNVLATLRARQRHVRAMSFYRRFVPRGGLAFDVGANLGDRTDLLLSLGSRVVAVEPQAALADALRRRFADRIELVEAALGPEPGEAELLLASYHTLASLSPDWVDAVRASGRFSEFTWGEKVVVPMTTLDDLISRFGVPDFCKIDVEGFELEVLRGLSQPVPTLSFEFTFEQLESRLEAVRHLGALGMTRFNFSMGESLELALGEWLDESAIERYLADLPARVELFGDVYAKE